MSETISSYKIIFYGGEKGYQDARAQIQVFSGDTSLGRIRFYDQDQPASADKEVAGQLVIHLPLSTFSAVLDVLRNERDVTLSMAGARGQLKASKK